MAEATSGKTSGENNLDLSQVENQDLQELAEKIEDFYKKDSTVKARLAYNWDRNHKFLDGQQWIVYDGDRDTGGIWKRLTVSKANEWIPRPVTNYIFDAYQTLKSYLIKNKPRSNVRPNTQEYRDKAAAKIGDLCLESNWERLSEETNYEYGAACLLTYGTVFKKDYWDISMAGAVPVPRMQMVPQTDPTTGQLLGESEQPVLDEAGNPVVDQIPLGDVNTRIVEPYRMALDPEASAMHDLKWIMEYAIQPIDWIKETFGKTGDGYTGRIDEVKEESTLSGSMRRFQQLKNSSGTKGTAQFAEGSGGSAGDYNMSNQAVVKEYYERPTAKNPKGRMVVVANGIPLFAGDSPYAGPEQGDWHPFSECRWEIVPGRFWGKSPLDVGCDIQKQINSIDAVIILTRKTMAIPQKLIPIGAGIAPGTWTGRPGQEIYARDSGGAMPSIIPGAGVDPTVFQERAQRLEDLKNCMGAIDILKGDRPPGVTAASALNLLYEVGTGKLFPILDRWKKFIENSQKKQLKLIAKKYQEPRPQYTAMLLAKNTDLDPQSIAKFIGSDLYDNCNVVVEAGANVPKLQAAKQAALQEAAQAGTLALEQPANRNEYNRQMGISGFDNDVGPDIARAEWENDCLDNVGKPDITPPLVLQVDKDDVHMEVLARAMKKPAFMTKPAPVQQAYMQHYMAHMQAEAQKKQAAVMEAMATTGQPPQPEDSNAAQPLHSAGKGVSPAQSNVMKIDMMKPGAMKGTP